MRETGIILRRKACIHLFSALGFRLLSALNIVAAKSILGSDFKALVIKIVQV